MVSWMKLAKNYKTARFAEEKILPPRDLYMVPEEYLMIFYILYWYPTSPKIKYTLCSEGNLRLVGILVYLAICIRNHDPVKKTLLKRRLAKIKTWPSWHFCELEQ